MCGAPGDVRFVPIAGIATDLLDHLVGGLLQTQRHVEAQCLGGLGIDDQLEASSAPAMEDRPALPLGDAVDVTCREAKLFAANVTIRDQAA